MNRMDVSLLPHLLDGVDLRRLADQVPTPFYAYSSNAIRKKVVELQQALQGLDYRICYAVKANPTAAVLRLMAEHGVGADVVSVGEMQRSLKAGIPAGRIVFSGVGKTADEISIALDAGLWRFNVESADELDLLQAIAGRKGVQARASVRINPNVDAGTHEKISTGKSENKFGVDIDEARQWFATAASRPNVLLDGLHAHIGSQILSLEPFREALRHMRAFHDELVAKGHVIACIDLGGGLGVAYRAEDRPVAVADYATLVREIFAGFAGTLVLEPGRHLVAEAGVLVSRVIRIKHGLDRSFLVLDAAMNDLLRPSLYEAWHEIVPLLDAPRPRVRYDVVGPVCETGDTFARGRAMSACAPGDLVRIGNAGAYGASMGSTYNSRPLIAEVLLDGGRYAVVRRRQTLDEMISGEQPAQDWHEA